MSRGFTLERTLIYVLIIAVLGVFAFLFFLFFSQATRSIVIQTPNGGEEWGIGYSHEISWEAKGIDKVGIVLFEGTEPKWIAKDIDANEGEYQWKIYPGQEYGDDYWIAVFEYPWKKGNRIDFSDGAFAIIYADLTSCDSVSIFNEWPYVPSDMPRVRRVFITEERYKGNLGGLDGADRICQMQAQKQGYEGTWYAFLGGDSDDDLAVKRLKETPRGTKGIYVEAKPDATLIRDATCHRLLGKDFDGFLKRFSDLSIISKDKLEKDFFNDFSNIWLGRLDAKSKKSCIEIDTGQATFFSDESLTEKYSLTTTCQNWTTGDKFVKGYPVPQESSAPSFPTCYTPAGKHTQAVALGGLGSGFTDDGENSAFTAYKGGYCNDARKLLCIEE